MNKWGNRIIWLLLIALLFLSFYNIYLLYSNRAGLRNDIHNSVFIAVDEHIKNRIDDELKSIKDSEPKTIIKVERGQNGKDSLSTHTIFKTEVIKEVPVPGVDGKTPVKGVDYVDGRTPLIQCNTYKNRWEVRYSDIESWTIVRDQNGLSVRCTL